MIAHDDLEASATLPRFKSNARLFLVRSLVVIGLAGAPLAASGPAQAARVVERTFCGERQGTAGEASLVDGSGRVTLTLARQGGDQHLLDQADDRVGRDPSGETGTQVGQSYCLVAQVDGQGRAQSIVSGQRVAPVTTAPAQPHPR